MTLDTRANETPEEDKLIAVFLQIRERMIDVAFKMTENLEDAEDIVSQVLLNIMSIREKSYIIDRYHRLYIYRAVRNRAHDHLKDMKSRNKANQKSAASSSINPTQEEDTNQKELLKLFNEVLDMMQNQNHRLTLQLRIFNEMEYKEIADQLKIPEGTVMSQLYYARQAAMRIIDSDPKFNGLDLKKFQNIQ